MRAEKINLKKLHRFPTNWTRRGFSYRASYIILFIQNGDMPGDDWMLRLAADFQQKSNDIWANIGQGENKEFIDWLQRW